MKVDEFELALCPANIFYLYLSLYFCLYLSLFCLPSNLCRPVTWIKFQRKWWLTAVGRNCQENTAMMVGMRCGTLCASGSKPCSDIDTKNTPPWLFPQKKVTTSNSPSLNHQMGFFAVLHRTELTLFDPAVEYLVEKHVCASLFFLIALVVGEVFSAPQ